MKTSHFMFLILLILILFSCSEIGISTDDINRDKDLSSIAPKKVTQLGSVTFTNPLGDGADPYIVKAGGKYWKCGSTGTAVYVHDGTETLTNANGMPATCVYTPPAGTMFSCHLWAPELHYLSGRWYIYCCADDGVDANHRMYVLEGGTDSTNPLSSPFLPKAKLIPIGSDYFAIDGHPFFYGNQLYFVWSGWPSTTSGTQRLYIAKMSNPYTISSARVEISRPDNAWEQIGYPTITVNEGPHVLISGTTVNIIYSASASWLDDYCLGRLTCTSSNLLLKSNWVKTGPVFSKTSTVWGPGHASFVTSLDNKQFWIIYHGAKYSGAGWDRDVRMQQYSWDANIPYFGKPLDPGVIMSGASNGETPLVNGVYKITSKNSNKCMDVPAGTSTPGTIIQQWSDNGNIAQRWLFTDMGDGYYKISSMCNNLCLDNAGSSINPGTKIIQWTDNGANAQRWRVENYNNGYFRIVNKKSLLAIDMPSFSDGAQFQQWILNIYDAQLFKIELQP